MQETVEMEQAVLAGLPSVRKKLVFRELGAREGGDPISYVDR